MSFQDWEILRGLRKNFLNTVKLAYVFGDCALLILKNGKVYGLGDNTGGCLAFPNLCRYGLPTEISKLSRKKTKGLISGGDEEDGVFVISYSDSEIYLWGCIVGSPRIRRDPSPVGVNLKIVAKTVACGKSNFLILSGDGKVFSSTGKSVRLWPEPVRLVKGIIENKKAINISCGYEFCAILLDDGKVVTWGNNEKGQLGLNHLGGWSNEPSEVSSLGGYYEAVIERIACGREHVLALSNTGRLYVWGANDFHQLGIKDHDNLMHGGCPKEVETDNLRFANIGASYLCNLSVAQCVQGKVYVWGETTKGNLLEPTATDCESVDQAFVSFAKSRIMLRPMKLENTSHQPAAILGISSKKVGKPKIRIYVKTTYGKTVSFFAESTDTIERIKQRVEEVEGTPPDQQRLVFDGRQMEDGRTLQDYGVETESLLYLVIRLRGS